MTMAIGPLIGAGVSLYTGMRAASLQKKAIETQEKQQKLADARDRRRLLRAQQIAAGQATNVAANIGGMGSSGLQGGIAGLQNQVASQVGFQAQTSALSRQASSFMQQASNYNMYGDLFGSLFSNMNLGRVGYSGSGLSFTRAT